MEVKIAKVDLSVTNNGTIKANVYPEGSDINNIAESIEIIGDECIYLATRKIGETVEIVTKGKWKNVVLDDAYLKALNSPSYDRIKLMFKRSVAGMNKIANGDRTQLNFDTAKALMQNNLELFVKTQDFITKSLKEFNTDFSKQLIEELNSDNVDTHYNALKVINDLTQKNLNELQKDYKIVCSEEDKKKTSK